MTAPAPTTAVEAFFKSLPPGTGPDFVKLLRDFGIAVEADADPIIRANAPKVPFLGGFLGTEEVVVFNTTLNNALDQADAYFQTGGT